MTQGRGGEKEKGKVVLTGNLLHSPRPDVD